jgi:hypothetical protein
MTIYEDGKRIASNWGKYVREWNFTPSTLFAAGVADELYVFAEPLTDAQIAQLAKGQKPTGPAIPITPEAKRRANDLARYGWDADNSATLPVIELGNDHITRQSSRGPQQDEASPQERTQYAVGPGSVEHWKA